MYVFIPFHSILPPHKKTPEEVEGILKKHQCWECPAHKQRSQEEPKRIL